MRQIVVRPNQLRPYILNGAIVLSAMSMVCGCKDSTRAQLFAMGSKHRITLYSGGVAVKTWTSTGNVSNQEHSDGYYFEDESTHKLVEVSGQVVIEQL